MIYNDNILNMFKSNQVILPCIKSSRSLIRNGGKHLENSNNKYYFLFIIIYFYFDNIARFTEIINRENCFFNPEYAKYLK
jgi:hypothetical protein